MKKIKANATNGTNATNGAPAAECKPDQFKLIPRAEIFPDPDQPRKTFDEARLKELADSIAADRAGGGSGIVQPLIVRHLPATHTILEPDLHDKDFRLVSLKAQADDIPTYRHVNPSECKDFADGAGYRLKDRYVIVAGERRWRAAELAGLTELPCLVRDMDARRVFAQQIIENNQREGVSAIEEARALDREFNRRRAENPAFKKEDFAKEIGMSRADFYGTLVLTRLHKPVEEALLAGKISPSHAKVIAIVPLPKQQEKLLATITDEHHYSYPFSVRDVQELVEEEYCKQLKDAPFDQKLTYGDSNNLLNPCAGCLDRTGNMVEEFPELKQRPNICTRPDCFAQKCKAHWLATAQAEAQRGTTVLTENEFKAAKGKYVEAEKPGYLFKDHYYATPDRVLGKHAPEPVLVSTAEGLKKVYKVEDLPAAAAKARVKLNQAEKPETPEEKEARAQKEKAEKEREARREAVIIELAPKLGAAMAKVKDSVALELIAADCGAQIYADGAFRKALAKHVKGSKARVLYENLTDTLEDAARGDKECFKVWSALGVDVEAAFAAAEKEAQSKLALPAKKGAEQGDLIEVKGGKKKLSAAARARIVAAQKARWAKLKAAK